MIKIRTILVIILALTVFPSLWANGGTEWNGYIGKKDAVIVGQYYKYSVGEQGAEPKYFQEYYIDEKKIIHGFFRFPQSDRTGYETMEMNWDTGMMESYTFLDQKDKVDYKQNDLIETKITLKNNQVVFESFVFDEEKGLQKSRSFQEYKIVPSYLGNFWGREIIFFLRFIDLEQGEKMPIGSFMASSFAAMTLLREADEVYHGTDCKIFTYSVNGLLGVFGGKGKFFVSQENGDVLLYESSLPLNTLKNLHMELLESRIITPEEWKEMTGEE